MQADEVLVRAFPSLSRPRNCFFLSDSTPFYLLFSTNISLGSVARSEFSCEIPGWVNHSVADGATVSSPLLNSTRRGFFLFGSASTRLSYGISAQISEVTPPPPLGDFSLFLLKGQRVSIVMILFLAASSSLCDRGHFSTVGAPFREPGTISPF